MRMRSTTLSTESSAAAVSHVMFMEAGTGAGVDVHADELAGAGLARVEVDHVPHLLAVAQHNPVVPVKRQRIPAACQRLNAGDSGTRRGGGCAPWD